MIKSIATILFECGCILRIAKGAYWSTNYPLCEYLTVLIYATG